MSGSEKQKLCHGFEQAFHRQSKDRCRGTLEADDPAVVENRLTENIPATVPERIEITSPGDPLGTRIVMHPPRYTAKSLKARILVAEDQRENQAIIVLRLKLVEAEVTVVPNGLEAVNAVVEANDGGVPFDLVLMDMQMPVLDGYGATKAIRDEGFDRLPIVALTAHALPEDREECLRYGCDDHIAKPIPWNTLYETLAGLLNRALSRSHSTDR